MISCAAQSPARTDKILTLCILAALACSHLSNPNYKNGPFPCSPDSATGVSIAACTLYAVSACLACCLPKPMPVLMRVRKSMQEDDKTDSCFAIFEKKPPEENDELEEGEGEAAGTEDEEKGAEVRSEWRQEVCCMLSCQLVPSLLIISCMSYHLFCNGKKEQLERTDEEYAEQLQRRQAEAAIATALATVRRGKQEEIEKQLELLTTYKDHYLAEDEYDEKVTKLMQALPDPDTYDAYTKTEALVVTIPPSVSAVEKDVDTEVEVNYCADGEAEEEGKGEEKEGDKKSIGSKISSSISSGVTSVKKTVGLGGGSFKTPAEAGETSNLDQSNVE